MQALLDNFNPNSPIRLSDDECTYTGYTKLIYLIDLDVSPDIIQEFLKNTSDDINKKYEYRTAIAWLCSSTRIYNFETLKVMIKYGANIDNVMLGNLLQYVITCSQVQDIDLIHYLVKQKLSVTVGDISCLIRYNSMTSFHRQVIMILIENGLDLNEKEDWTGHTILSKLCMSLELDKIQFLLDLGVNPNAPGDCHYSDFKNHCIINLLMFNPMIITSNKMTDECILQKIMESCYILFQYGATFELVTERGKTLRSLLENRYDDVNDIYPGKYRCRFWNNITDDDNISNVDKIIKYLEQFCARSYVKSARNIAK